MLFTTVNDKNMPNCSKNLDKQKVYNFLKLLCAYIVNEGSCTFEFSPSTLHPS